MAQQFKSVLTLAGQALVAQAIGGGPAVTITHVCIGDGGGGFVTPIETQAALVNEVWRGPVISAARDPDHPTHLIVTAQIPSSAGPTVVRELGLVASTGELFAVRNNPEIEIPATAQGAEVLVDVTFVVVVDTAAVVTVMVDPDQLIGLAGMLRAPFIAIDSFAAAPPANPALGALVVAAAGAGGAFAGLDHKFVQWSGSLWLSAVAPIGTIVANAADGTYYRRTGAGWQAVDDGQFWCTAGGTANAITLASPTPMLSTPLALRDGLRLLFKPTAANTGAVTLNAWGKGAAPLVDGDGSALAAGALSPTRMVEAIRLGGNWVLAPWCSPATIHEVVRTMHVSHCAVTDAGGQTAVPSGVSTDLGHVSQLGGSYFEDSTWAASRLTIGERDGGNTWMVIAYAAIEVLTAPTLGDQFRISVTRNGVGGPFNSVTINGTGTYGAIAFLPFDAVKNDVLRVTAFHNLGMACNVKATMFFAFRISRS